jgi:hypothetical protein
MAARIEAALFYKVTQNAGVAALIGTRFTPTTLPQTVVLFPAAVYQFITGAAIKEHGNPTSLPRQRCQITCWSNIWDDLPPLDKAIKTAIDGKREYWGTGSYITKVLSCVAENTPRDDKDPVTGLFWRSRDYFIRWQE